MNQKINKTLRRNPERFCLGACHFCLESVDKKYARIKALQIVVEELKKVL